MHYNFKYYIPSKVHFGSGITDGIGDYLKEVSMRQILVVTDPNISSLKWFQSIMDKIINSNYSCYIFDKVHCEPSDDDVNAALMYAQDKNIDGIIGIGGGSSMDCAKCVATALSSGIFTIEPFLRPGKKEVERKFPLVLIPTTAGTGAEITRGAVIIDKAHQIKRGFGNGGYYADLVLIDPNLGMTLTQKQIATSGLDALCHAMESYLVNKTNPICKIWSYASLKLIWDNLANLYFQNDMKSREKMFLGSLLATMSFCTGVGLTFSHHISDVLGGTYNIPHGFASFYTLPNTIKIFTEKNNNNYSFQDLTEIFGVNVLNALEDLTLLLRVPEYTNYFSPMSCDEINTLYNRVLNNSYRASGLDGEELLLVLQNSFSK